MNEEFLKYLWKYKLLTPDLYTEKNDKIEIISSGQHNTNSGPDFFNAKVKIGDTLWAGNVEIHTKSSDWNLHRHTDDDAYDSIILHVVLKNDLVIYRKNKEVVPVLIVEGKYDNNLYLQYQDFIENHNWIPCEKLIENVDKFILYSWLERLSIERLERKTSEINDIHLATNMNWSETFYRVIAKNFGFKLNALPFELLAKSLPLAYLARHKNSLFQLEAMLFGQAGMLNSELKDVFPLALRKEYEFLKKKYHLQPIESSLWKFLRLRPVNFPTIRISQFAHFIYKSSSIFSKILESNDIKDITNMFEVTASDYFDTHFIFDEPTLNKKSKIIGEYSASLLILNTIIPLIFLYGIKNNDTKYKQRAMKFLEQLKPENNSIIKRWILLKIKPENASQSQALLELKNVYCDNKKCLECRLGSYLLK